MDGSEDLTSEQVAEFIEKGASQHSGQDYLILAAILPHSLLPAPDSQVRLSDVLKRLLELVFDPPEGSTDESRRLANDRFVKAARGYIGWTDRSYEYVKKIALEAKLSPVEPEPDATPDQIEVLRQEQLNNVLVRRGLAAVEVFGAFKGTKTLMKRRPEIIRQLLAAMHTFVNNPAAVQYLANDLGLHQPNSVPDQARIEQSLSSAQQARSRTRQRPKLGTVFLLVCGLTAALLLISVSDYYKNRGDSRPSANSGRSSGQPRSSSTVPTPSSSSSNQPSSSPSNQPSSTSPSSETPSSGTEQPPTSPVITPIAIQMTDPPNLDPPYPEPQVIRISGIGTIQPGYNIRIFVYGSGSHMYYWQSGQVVSDGTSWAVDDVNIGGSGTADDGSLFTVYVTVINNLTANQIQSLVSPGLDGGYSQDAWTSWFDTFKVSQATVRRVN